ncbi:MAG: bifunctional chorismate mutase/prephenate dehydrogenase [Phycisphaerales bacterium]|nr:bifunctional chorismate mutase/prephenate dehydrogenase [Phycisphaerales bacterium]
MKPESKDDARQPRPLPVLREMIDAVDHQILELMAQRNKIVNEVARFKRTNAVRIRDFRRERELLSDRRNRATDLGINPDVAESLWRLVLWASRDRQAALRAEVPPNLEGRTIAVIGGNGAMGRCFAGLFQDLGSKVMVVDQDTKLKAAEAAACADAVLISVPIDATLDVIAEVGPHLRKESLLFDLTSIKKAPVEAMLASSSANIIGTHPLFGPSVHSLQGQRIALTPARLHPDSDWLQWLTQVLEARGMQIINTTPERHDHVMAIVQVLTHFSTEVLGATMSKLGFDLKETVAFTSPVYLMDLYLTARHFAQDASLYASIQHSNSSTEEITGVFAKVATDLNNIASNRDEVAFNAMFDQVRSFFGDFTDEALEQSSFLIDRLVERT